MTMMASIIVASGRGIADLDAAVREPGPRRAAEQRTLTSAPSLTTAWRRALLALASDCSHRDDDAATSRWTRSPDHKANKHYSVLPNQKSLYNLLARHARALP